MHLLNRIDKVNIVVPGLMLMAVFVLTAGCGTSNSSSGTAASSSSSSPSSLAADARSFQGYGCSIPSTLAPVEKRPLLVVRVNYNDKTFDSSASVWAEKIFGNSLHELNDYYDKTSGGRFQFEPITENDGVQDGIVTVSVDKDHPTYTTDSDDDIDFSTLHPDLTAALSETNNYVDYAAYDADKNGAITPDELVIMFILAGSEYAFAPTDVPGIWAHVNCVDASNAATLDGVTLMQCSHGGNYAVFGERHIQGSYNEDATVGVIAHELGHATFDLPDLYDTSGQSAGIGYFGLMSAGMWGRSSRSDAFGNTPVSMTAWSKVVNGWIEPVVLDDVNITPLFLNDTASAAYNIALLPISDHECYMIENRSVEGYDAGLNSINSINSINSYYRGGLALWHIDQTVIDKGMNANTVNADAAHKGVDLVEASDDGLDDDYTFPGDAHNLFWEGNVDSFTASTRYDGSSSGVEITGIGTPDSTMSAVITNPNKVLP